MTTLAEVDRAVAAPAVAFNVDAMLMYGWVADANRNVTHVSNSLQRWIREHRWCAGEANRLLDVIHEGKVGIEAFLQSLLDPDTERGTGELVGRYMTRLEELVSDSTQVDSSLPEDEAPYQVLLQYHAPRGTQQPLAGARFVRDSATLLASRWNSERVDVVVVAIAEQHDGWWRLRGFQGQLQEAWLRVSRRIFDGNRAAGLALMARNLSHNIGSHALYWVASGLGDDPEKQRFLTYMQIRMELLAGFATAMPLAPVTQRIEDVVENFKSTKLLLNNICRSEGIESVTLEAPGYKDEAVFFGGELGVHAFYSILENCIRDSAKYSKAGRCGEPLKMHVVATEREKFIQIDVFDEAGGFAEHGENIRRSVERLRLAYDTGQLDERNWGIKERFICAAVLRGIRPEEIRLSGVDSPDQPWLGTFQKNDQRILEMVDAGGNCAWRFYLPRRHAEVLLVTDRQADVPEGVQVQTVSQFGDAVKLPTGITAPFVVLDGVPSTAGAAQSLIARLPYRTYVVGDTAGDRFIQVEDAPQQLTATLLLERSIRRLASPVPRLILGIREADCGGKLQFMSPDSDAPVLVVPYEKLDGVLEDLHQRAPGQKLAVIRRHSGALYPHLCEHADDDLHQTILYFERYDSRPYLKSAVMGMKIDPVRTANRLIEAAVTKILILDERLDLGLCKQEDIVRGALSLRGITVHGHEFAGYASMPDPVSLDEVAEWARGAHFVVLHRGIAEKLSLRWPETDFRRVVDALERHGSRVVIHSGRMGMADMPPQTKFLSWANVSAWVDREYSKVQIVDELFSLRRI